MVSLVVFGWLNELSYFEGREEIMAQNCRIIQKYVTDQKTPLLSTRVTHWQIAEKSPNRARFRGLLSEKIHAGVPIKRLWQIQTVDDINRMESYLYEYLDYDNYSLKAIVDKRVLIPELICIGGKIATMSFPEIGMPRKIGRLLILYKKHPIQAVESYFHVLWEMSSPVKIGAELYKENLKSLRDSLAEGQKLESERSWTNFRNGGAPMYWENCAVSRCSREIGDDCSNRTRRAVLACNCCGAG